MHRTKSLAFDFGCLTHLGNFKLSTIVALVIFALALGSQPLATADIFIATPPGLTPGDTFRIVFVTHGTTDATSTNIADYNTFVNNDATAEAGGGTVSYNGTALTFSAIASTATVNAITNIGQTGAPEYLSTGLIVATNDTMSGLWSGGILNPITFDLLGGVSPNYLFVWTGTDLYGAADPTPGVPGPTLGTRGPEGGLSTSASNLWVDAGTVLYYDEALLYGISQQLTVPGGPAVPEPSAIVLWLTAAGCGAVIACVRRRRAAQGC
jgi:hypothetical protein